MKLYNKFCKARGLIAQLVEQLTLNQLVEGSSPSEPKTKEVRNGFFFLWSENSGAQRITFLQKKTDGENDCRLLELRFILCII